MTLLDIASRLNEFDADGVIYAERINGVFTAESRAIVQLASAEEDGKPVSEMGARSIANFGYCLEVCIAQDAVEIWSKWREGRKPTFQEAAEAICHKANFDSWGPPNW